MCSGKKRQACRDRLEINTRGMKNCCDTQGIILWHSRIPEAQMLFNGEGRMSGLDIPQENLNIYNPSSDRIHD